MKKIEISLLLGVIGLAAITTIVKIGIVTLFTTGGVEYSQVETQQQDLERENITLKEKILFASSYNTIASEAATLGFQESDKKSRLVLTNPAPIAFGQ